MKVFVLVSLGLLAQTMTVAQNRAPQGTRPPRQGTAITILDFVFVPQTLQELRDYSELIVEGTVENSMPAREHGSGLETDVLVTVSRVVKGDPSLRSIVLTEVGGTQGAYREAVQNDSPMRAGERYVFFLVADQRADIPVIAGRRRYTAVCAWIGKGQIVGSKIVISPAASQSLRDAYDGVTTEHFLDAILAQ